MKEIPLQVSCDGNALKGGAFVPDDADRSVVLLHGLPSVSPPDPEDSGYRGFARTFAEQGWVAGWADMRAVRDSEGYFSIEGWVTDVAAIVGAIRDLKPTGFLAVVGSSAGGAVATVAVGRGLQVDALALLAAPAAWLSFAADPVAGLTRITQEAGMSVAPDVMENPTEWATEFERVVTRDAIGAVDVPVLVMHGDADDVVPVDHAADISMAARDAELHILKGGAHQLRRDERALHTLLQWLERVSSR